ncbi:signal peptidase I [candidate division WOR-3 bacterium]|nr:signal peptidase I [candidate division WOR-3 bacterium]
MSEKLKKEIASWVVVIIVVLILRAIFVQAYVIPTGSMEKTLLIGDALLVNRFVYGIKIPVPFSNHQISLIPGRNPKRGEIIVFQYPFEKRDFVKRCVAIEDDTVEIINKKLHVNGKEILEPYIWYQDKRTFRGANYDRGLYQQKWERSELPDIFGYQIRDNFGPVIVPKDCIFVMGDNRDNSMDSRFWGPLHKKFLKGKPLFIYFSFDPGREASSILDILKVWQWKSIRLMRIGKVT